MTTDASQAQTVPPPICDQAEFDELVTELVADETPRLFAVVHELGERADAWIAAWGLAFDDHVELVGEGDARLSLSSPERVLWMYGLRPDLTPHLIWLTPPRASEDCSTAV